MCMVVYYNISTTFFKLQNMLKAYVRIQQMD
jgi:hypothetical protein